MAQPTYSRRAIIGVGLGATASLAGCLGQDSGSDPESSGSDDGTSCDGIDGEITSLPPDTGEYSVDTTETFTDDSPFGERATIAVYPDIDGGKYEFLVIEFADAETASNTLDEVLAGNDFDETGYILAGEYFAGVGGPSQDTVRSLMEASSLGSACLEEIQFD